MIIYESAINPYKLYGYRDLRIDLIHDERFVGNIFSLIWYLLIYL
jgi:hypothetical protein